MRVDGLKAELLRKEDELESYKFELARIDVHLHRTDSELAEARNAWLRAMDEKPRDLSKAQALQNKVWELQSKLTSAEKQHCLDNIRSLQGKIDQLKQEIRNAEQEQQSSSSYNSVFRR